MQGCRWILQSNKPQFYFPNSFSSLRIIQHVCSCHLSLRPRSPSSCDRRCPSWWRAASLVLLRQRWQSQLLRHHSRGNYVHRLLGKQSEPTNKFNRLLVASLPRSSGTWVLCSALSQVLLAVSCNLLAVVGCIDLI